MDDFNTITTEIENIKSLLIEINNRLDKLENPEVTE
jgi:hypothetical protein